MKLSRRGFGRMSLAGAGAAAAPMSASTAGNSWSDSGMKLGVSHQRAEMLTGEHLRYLKQMGVEYVELRTPAARSSYEELAAMKRAVENAGLKVFEIMLSDKYKSPEFTLGGPRRDEEIRFFQDFLKDLGRLGVDTTTYAWYTGGVFTTSWAETRGCKTRMFELDKALAEPRRLNRDYSGEEMWDNYEYFIRRVLPIAEDVGVRLQLHPNDPPADHLGVARIFKSRAAFRRAMEICNHSPYSGLLFCVGSWAEMAGEDGKGEDIPAAIRELGSQGHIYQVHYRNVSSPLPVFRETFPDLGWVNMYEVAKALGEAHFNGMIVPDHAPRCGAGDGKDKTGEAYIFGYIRAMIQAVETELGRHG